MRALPPWVRSVGPLALADLRRRYAGSALGGLWAVVGPLLEVVAYALVFGLVLGPRTSSGGLTFGLYIAAGLLPWSALREGLEGSAAVLPENRWIRRSRVPMELLVARHAVVSAARGAAGLVLVLAFVFARGPSPGVAGALLPLVALYLQTVSVYGLGLVLAPLATVYPDLRPGLASALTLLTFASPIVYPESLPGSALRALLEWNPFTHFLRLYRFPLGPGIAAFGPADLAVVFATPVVLLALGSLLKDRLFWAARDHL
jgi:ABC-type polysaccharide/polyol phosphate export permease